MVYKETKKEFKVNNKFNQNMNLLNNNIQDLMNKKQKFINYLITMIKH